MYKDVVPEIRNQFIIPAIIIFTLIVGYILEKRYLDLLFMGFLLLSFLGIFKTIERVEKRIKLISVLDEAFEELIKHNFGEILKEGGINLIIVEGKELFVRYNNGKEELFEIPNAVKIKKIFFEDSEEYKEELRLVDVAGGIPKQDYSAMPALLDKAMYLFLITEIVEKTLEAVYHQI